MTLPFDSRLTSTTLWQGALILAIVDTGFVTLLAWRIKPARFSELKWPLVITTGVFWGLLWVWVLANFWEPVYSYIFPGWAYRLIPVAFGLLFACVGFVIWQLAPHLPGTPVFSFCLLGGLWGMITHLWAVYLGIVEKPALLQGVTPAAAVVFAAFEYMFYWCVILSVSMLFQVGSQWLSALRPRSK